MKTYSEGFSFISFGQGMSDEQESGKNECGMNNGWTLRSGRHGTVSLSLY